MRIIERILESGLLAKSNIELCFRAIGSAQEIVDRCSGIVEMQGKLVQ